MDDLVTHLMSKKQYDKVTKLRELHVLQPDEDEEEETG
eukprot:CAMPEP_0170558236 /NCGR_PEP_ID=MMETSP0211-20121228/33813_1 /TAXON_ID=311385 /ORGANISM="Pseudokeronopsis sp., Strain OXSARD2" /LENGTH=37 /DNA_ID= /DNA_START= /DNA_END= /DNA_ORIENTATION=